MLPINYLRVWNRNALHILKEWINSILISTINISTIMVYSFMDFIFMEMRCHSFKCYGKATYFLSFQKVLVVLILQINKLTILGRINSRQPKLIRLPIKDQNFQQFYTQLISCLCKIFYVFFLFTLKVNWIHLESKLYGT